MRIVVQRVSRAEVEIEDKIASSIGRGLLILVGIEGADNQDDAEWLAGKIARLRIFDDDGGVMNRSVIDIGGEVLVVSQFTLHGDVGKGNRPSYNRAAAPVKAVPLYELFVSTLRKETEREVKTGQFGARMSVKLTNDGPVTIIMDTREIRKPSE